MQPTTPLSDDTLEKAIFAAALAREHAYAPYSKFHVGACVVANSGEMFSGCNVENASYGLSQCAERSAVTAATAKGHRAIVACVIVTSGLHPTSPCGACRQVLYECSKDMIIVCRTVSGKEKRYLLSDLLPDAFTTLDIQEST